MFHYPNITPIYTLLYYGSFHSIFHYSNITLICKSGSERLACKTRELEVTPQCWGRGLFLRCTNSEARHFFHHQSDMDARIAPYLRCAWVLRLGVSQLRNNLPDFQHKGLIMLPPKTCDKESRSKEAPKP